MMIWSRSGSNIDLAFDLTEFNHYTIHITCEYRCLSKGMHITLICKEDVCYTVTVMIYNQLAMDQIGSFCFDPPPISYLFLYVLFVDSYINSNVLVGRDT